MTTAAKRFSLDTIAPTLWKNGGGTTREIAAWPPGAGMEDFAWRVSVADIAADGPFSAFPGIDRQIVLLEGAGVHLQAHDDSFCHRLTRIGEPYPFAGDTAVHATLVGGPTRDFNVMTRRGRCVARVDLRQAGFAIATGTDAVLVFVIRGTWRDDAGQALGVGEGMLFPADAGFAEHAFTPIDVGALCLCVLLQTERTG